MRKAGRKLARRLRPAAARVREAGRRLGAAGRALRRATPGLRKAGRGAGRILGSLGGKAAGVLAGAGKKAAGGIGGGAKGLLQVVEAMRGKFLEVTATAQGFVQALNPASILVLSQAFRDLQATVGVALQPVVDAAAVAVREFGAVLRPVMEQLRPTIQGLSQTFLQVSQVAFNAFGSVARAVMPVVEVLGRVVESLAPVVQATAAAFSGLVEATAGAVKGLLGWAGVDMGGVMDSLKSAMQTLAKYTLLAAANVMKFFSATAGNNFIDGAVRALSGEGVEKKSAAGLAAPTDARIGGLGDFGRRVTQASLLAGREAPGQGRKTEDWLADVVEQLGKVRTGQESDLKALKDAVVKAIGELPAEIAAALTKKTTSWAKEKGGDLGWLVSNPGAALKEILGFGTLYK